MTLKEFNDKWTGYGVWLETVDVTSAKGGLQIYKIVDIDEDEDLGYFETVEDADKEMAPSFVRIDYFPVEEALFLEDRE